MKNFEKYFLNESLSDNELSDILLNTINYYFEQKNIPSFKSGQAVRDTNMIRSLGFIEGILVAIGVLEAGQEYDYKEFTYKYLWVFKGKTTESYGTYIIRISLKYLKDNNKIDDSDIDKLLKNK